MFKGVFHSHIDDFNSFVRPKSAWVQDGGPMLNGLARWDHHVIQDDSCSGTVGNNSAHNTSVSVVALARFFKPTASMLPR